MIKKCLLTLVLAFSFATQAAEPITGPKVKPNEPLTANAFVELAKAINPAVVNVFTTYLPRGRAMPYGRDPFFDMFEQFMNPYGGGGGGAMQAMPQQALGSGFIIREDGLIITNNHVIDKADVIKVQISENTKESFDAKLIGKDARTDIALIKIDAKRKLPFVKLGSSSAAQVGEWVAAFGNPLGYGHTMTKGIISAVGRELNDINIFPFIQTDASINPGNSGGPLVNTQAEVIGVNTAIDARGQGIGFVIPIDNVKNILPQLEKDGKIQRAFLGVGMNDIDEESASTLNLKQTEGALVTQVLPGTSADKAGVLAYDLIIEYDGIKIASTHDLDKAVATTSVGKNVTIKLIRNNKAKSLVVHMEMRPDLKSAISASSRKGGEGGVRAPYDLGFTLADYNNAIAQEFGLPHLGNPRPVVVSVAPNGPSASAGLAPGDIVLDVNRNPTVHAKDVVRHLKRGTINILRILKQDRVVLISVRAS